MRIRGPAYSLRDAREEWGQFRPATIEALIFVGKVNRGVEVRHETGGPWLPITQVPELLALFETATGEKAKEAVAARKATPLPSSEQVAPGRGSSAAVLPALQPSANPTPPGILAPPLRLVPSGSSTGSDPIVAVAAAPAVAAPPGATYKVICSDGTMIGPLPLPHLLAQIWDGRVSSGDLVQRDAGKWQAAAEYGELGRAFERLSVPEQPAAGSSEALPTPTEAMASPSPSPVPDRAAAISSGGAEAGPGLQPPGLRRGSPQPEVRTATPSPAGGRVISLLPPPGGTAGPPLTLPPPRPAPTPIPGHPLVTPPPEHFTDEPSTEVTSRPQLAENLEGPGRSRLVTISAGEKSTFEGRLEASPLLKVLGRVLRTGSSGKLVLEGPYRLVLRCRQGVVIGAEREPPTPETEQLAARLLQIPETSISLAEDQGSSLLDGLLATGALDERGAASMASLIAFEETLGAFGWRTGAYAFVETPEVGRPAFHIHPFDLLRSGLAVGFTREEMEAAVRGWAQAAIAPGPASAPSQLASLPLSPEERDLLGLIASGRTFSELVDEAVDRRGMARALVINTLYLAYQLGMLTLVAGRTASSARAVAVGMFDPTLPMDVLVRSIQEADFFNLLGLPRGEEVGDVDSAFARARGQVRQLTGDPKQIERILARLERARTVLADPAQRKAYLEGGERALPDGGSSSGDRLASRPSDSGIRISTPFPRVGIASPATSRSEMATPASASGHDSVGGESRNESRNDSRSRTPDPRTTSKLELLQAQNLDKARKHIEAKQYGEALLLLRQLVKVAPMVGRFQAHLAWATLLDGRSTTEELMAALASLEQAANLDMEDPDTQYFLGQVHLRMESTRKARQSFGRALQLDPAHVPTRDALARLDEAARSAGGGDVRRMGIALGAFAVVFGVLFYLANYLGHAPHSAVDGFGAEELYYHPGNWFFYARRGLLLAVGLIGSYLVFRREKSHAVAGWSFLGLLGGMTLGYISYGMYAVSFPKSEIPAIQWVMGMVLLHAVAEEYFFRGFISRALLPFFEQLLPGALVVSLVYGLYHLTYVAYWWGMHYFHPGNLLGSMPVAIIGQAVTMGLPLTLLYGKSRSVLPGIFAQVGFGWVFLVLSILRAQG